jgi:carotenoid cleavage dioxygenase-like enzyme
MTITEHTTIYYFRTYDEALEVADANNAADDDGWIYAVRFHAGRQAHYIEVIDGNSDHIGYL